jgi:hypothetical protein
METEILRSRAVKAGAAKDVAKSRESAKMPMSSRPIEVVESYFGADGRPIKRKSIGAARVARQYDERGYQVEEAYFDASGEPVLSANGAARIAWRYDDRGRAIEAEMFGADGSFIARRAATRRRSRARELA